MNTQATAGSLESNDAFISISQQSETTNTILLESIVKNQFGDAILTLANTVLTEQKLTGALISINDRGALECTLRARLETAIQRYREVAS